MFAVLYQTGKQISIPSWDLQYYVSSVSSFKLPGAVFQPAHYLTIEFKD